MQDKSEISYLCIMAKENVYLASKPRYEILDGLRGVAALMVIIFHCFETYLPVFGRQIVNHGYLAVDFFFVLSGFVIGYAYDDRWDKMTTWGFFKRRLTRLHPMVIAGTLIGAALFFFAGAAFPKTLETSGWKFVLCLVMGLVMIPCGPRLDIRGWQEMNSFNGPNWSLTFEYIGNILYALMLRRLPTKWLAVISFAAGGMLATLTLHDGALGAGWTTEDSGLWTGLLRMLFPYSAGMLMARLFKPVDTRHTFALCSLAIIACASLPLLFGECASWASGLYDAACVIIIFPLIVWLGASARTLKTSTRHVCRRLGDLSYPLYAVHYPLMYLFYAHIGFRGDFVPITHLHDVWPATLALPVASILLAWLLLRFWDAPLRRRLTR